MRTDPPTLSIAETNPVYTVSELTEGVRLVLESSFPAFIYVEGEVSNIREAHPSGHVYFTMKDDSAQIRAVYFRGHRRTDRFLPENGTKVLAMGRMGVYPARGEYQLVVHSLEPAGLGKFFLEYRKVRQRLEAEGLLDPSRKRKLPRFPRKVALLTSLSGAVVWDFLRISGQRAPAVPIVIVPVRVQGESVPEEISEALGRVSGTPDLDAVVLARGGGSVEDLWSFNDERLARAILGSPVPVVSAIGHETNTTIADLVSDLRVATPSEAAERIFPDASELNGLVRKGRRSLLNSVYKGIRDRHREIEFVSSRVAMWPDRLERRIQDLDRIQLELFLGIQKKTGSELLSQERLKSRLDRFPFEGLARIERRLGDLVRALRNPYSVFRNRFRRWEETSRHLRVIVPAIVAENKGALDLANNRLSKGMEVLRSRAILVFDEWNGRLSVATPFSVLDRGFAILFHSGTRRLVTPSSPPFPGEMLIGRIPGYEFDLDVVEIRQKQKGEADV